MKLMLFWPSTHPESKILFETLIQNGHSIAYWVGLNETRHCGPQETIFHDHYDAWDGKPAPAFAGRVFPPPSPALINSLHAVESTILTMMNKHYDRISVDERRHIYYTMLAYWTSVLDEIKPDAIVFGVVPHTVYDHLTYALAQRRGIPCVFFEETWVAGRLLTYSDFKKGSDKLRQAYGRYQKQKISIDDLDPEIREYYKKQTSPKEDKTVWYMREQRSFGEGLGLWRHRARIALSSPLRVLPRGIALMMRRWSINLRREYSRVERPADFEKPYVYFPLSYQPERTSCPQGGIYQDQLLALETLVAALPPEWEVYVKEHPSQWWLRGKTSYSSVRYRGYYERIASISRMRIVPIHTNTFTLTERSRAVAVITGPAGWEGLLRGKHVLVFGYQWYRDCAGVSSVASAEDCTRVLQAIQKGESVQQKDVIAFLKALGDVSIRAHIGGDATRALPPIPLEDSMQVIAGAVVDALRSTRDFD